MPPIFLAAQNKVIDGFIGIETPLLHSGICGGVAVCAAIGAEKLSQASLKKCGVSLKKGRNIPPAMQIFALAATTAFFFNVTQSYDNRAPETKGDQIQPSLLITNKAVTLPILLNR